MPLVNTIDILKTAEEKKYAVGAFNAISLDFINGIVEAAEELSSPVILNLAESQFQFADISQIAPVVRSIAENSSVPIVLNLDHGLSVETAIKAIRNGFSAVMFDGSHMPFRENIEQTKLIVKLAHSIGVSVEGELGKIAGGESEGTVSSAQKDFFTNVSEAKIFVEETGVDALAISFGNVHGFYKGEPKLDFDLLVKIKDAVKIPIVLHGGSGIPDTDFQKAISLGVSKVNFFTEMSKSALEAVKALLNDDSRVTGLHQLIHGIRDAIKETVKDRIIVFGSANQCKKVELPCMMPPNTVNNDYNNKSNNYTYNEETISAIVEKVVSKIIK